MGQISASDPIYGHLNTRERRKVYTLKRRMEFLTDRIASYRHDGDPSHDKAEVAAIQWALGLAANLAPAVREEQEA